jgi:hypothetical protein
MPSRSPQQIAQQLLTAAGQRGQFSCLDSLWGHESGWDVHASNSGSGAYGIPQAVPGSKMASAGPDWQSDAATQIRWGLSYIDGRYGSPCGAWSHEGSDGWYLGRAYSKRMAAGAVMRRSSGMVTVITANAIARPTPIRA